MTKLQDALSGVLRLGLDTDAIIYFVQANPDHAALMSEIFRQISVGQLLGFTSTLSITETFILPLRAGDTALEQNFRDLLLQSNNLFSLAVDPAIAEIAADLRARYNLRTPDAVQAATAIHAGSDAFLTNNGKHFLRVTELQILVINELEL